MSTVTWADEQIVIATWASVGIAGGSLVAAIVVGVYVALTLKETRAATRAATTQATAAQEALKLEQERSEEARAQIAASIAASRREFARAERTRIDDTMPVVSVSLFTQPPVLIAPTTFEPALSRLPFDVNGASRMVRFTMLDSGITIDADTAETLRGTESFFLEEVKIEFRNHGLAPAHVQFSAEQTVVAEDGRPVKPLYLAPGDKRVFVSHRRGRMWDEATSADGGASRRPLTMQWTVGDIRGNGLDPYDVTLPMSFYTRHEDGAITMWQQDTTTQHAYERPVPGRRDYPREVGSSIAS